jgi:uncharacterized protein (DUF885 family)
MNTPLASLILTLSLGLGCSSAKPATKTPAIVVVTQVESERLRAFFADTFSAELARSPEMQSSLGIKTDYGDWDDRSEAASQGDLRRWISDLARLRSDFEFAKLDAQAQVSFRLFEYDTETRIEGHAWRFHSYPVNQMHGLQAEVPAFLINYHKVDSESDAKAYVQRLLGVRALFHELETQLSLRAQKGIMPPAFVYPHVIRDCENILVGKPFDEGPGDSTLLEDVRGKIDALSISQEAKAKLLSEATSALTVNVGPAYKSLAAYLRDEMKRAGTGDGVWRLPKGAEFYRFALARTTSTEMTGGEIHDLGLSEVSRIHGEMRAIMKATGFTGTLVEFFEFMRTDPQFYLSNDDAGRAQYLAQATELIDVMRGRLDELFITKPNAGIIVKRVEAFREQSAGKAFYSQPSPDGSRPGTYYANLYRMERMPTYQMEALAYHEGIPGHHMQIAIAQELDSLPDFRRHGGYTAYVEGWGLYSEYFPKEIGLYADPYSDFGRLAMELWRACRLVVDTGIHEKKWTRQEAIDYLKANTPNPMGDVVNAIERYIVMPSQATAYKIGMIAILRLREGAREKLGEKFDIREFHEVVLSNGSVPLPVLSDLVAAWVATKAAE